MQPSGLKEREQRYHTIFDTVAVSIWEEDFSWCKSAINKLKAQGIKDFHQYLAEHPHFVIEAIQRIKVQDVNQQSLKLFGAKSKDELMGSLNQIFVPEMVPVFTEELIAIAEDRNYFESEATVQTLQGQWLNILLTISFPEPSDPFDHVLVTVLDITERKRIENALLVTEERFRIMADNAPVLIWISDTEKLRTWFNRQWLKFVGRTLEQELGNGWVENVHPDDFEHCLYSYTTSFDAREPFSMEYRLRRHDGAWRWILDNGVPNHGPNKDFIGYIGSCIDITERKHAEASHREIFENANDAIYVHELETGKVLDVNNRATEISGFTKEEIINGNPSDFMANTPGNTTEDAMRYLQKAALEGKQTFEWQAKHKKGFLFWVEVSLYRATIAGTDRILAFFHEIEDRKKAEEKLKASELEYRSLIEQATDGIFISDEKGKYLDVNQSACKMLGYSKEELLEMSVHEILLPEEIKNNPPRFEELMAGKTILSTRNLKKKDGTVIPVEINAKMLSNKRMLGMVRDITERKTAQEKLEKNERLFRAMIEKNADMMTLARPNGELLYVSPSLTNILGFTFEEYQRRPTFDFIHPDDVPELIEQIMGIMDSPGKSFFRQQRLLHQDGTYRWCEGTVTNMLHDPNIRALVSNFRDITERKIAEEKIQKLNEELEQKVIERTIELERNIQQLKESEEKFQKAFQASAAGITISRLSDSTYLDVNNAFVEMTGYSREELIGHTSTELGMIANLKKRKEVLQQIRDLGSVKHLEMTIRNKSGITMEVLSSIETILLNGEKYAINILYDITERKKAEEQLETVNKELESFSYSVSHDLRAPLRSIIGYSKMLEEDHFDKLDNDGKRILGTIQHNASKMNGLINDLLKFAKLGMKELHKSMTDSNALVQKIISEIPSHAEIKVNSLLPSYADYTLLTQVWVNLISNAIKYSSKKENAFIEIGSYKKENESIYYVKDNGVGFDMGYYDKLFAVFQRLHGADDFEGTGVGLAIVHKIIEKHGGRLWAEGKIDEGATFYFSLPG